LKAHGDQMPDDLHGLISSVIVGAPALAALLAA
jgi:hypothetical protein